MEVATETGQAPATENIPTIADLAKTEPVTSTTTAISIRGGIVPRNTVELVRLAKLYVESHLAPKTLDSWQKVAVAMAMCIEQGRPVTSGIQDMAVINGKVSTYGDAALAMVRASGLLEVFEEWEEGTPREDTWTFYCKIKRKGSTKERVCSWSWVDAKAAGFDNPKMRDGNPDRYSPWRRFTRRMMQFKARNFPLRDEFGDILKGMRLAEDAQDIIDLSPGANGSFGVPESSASASEAMESLKKGVGGVGTTDAGADESTPQQGHDEPGQDETGTEGDSNTETGTGENSENAGQEFEGLTSMKLSKFINLRSSGLKDFVALFNPVFSIWPGHIKRIVVNKLEREEKWAPLLDEIQGVEKTEAGAIPEERNQTKGYTDAIKGEEKLSPGFLQCPDGKKVAFFQCEECRDGPTCKKKSDYIESQKM